MLKIIILLSIALISCTKDPRTLEDIQKSNELIIGTRNSPTTYYQNRDGQYVGFEHDMATAFAKHLNVKPKFKVYDSTQQILDAIRLNKIDVAAAGLSQTESRKEEFLFSDSYKSVEQNLVCRKGIRINDPSDIKNYEIIVPKGTSYIQSLNSHKKQNKDISWKVKKSTSTVELLREVGEESIDCTVADSPITAIIRRYYPDITVVMNVGPPSKLSWLFNEENEDLMSVANLWFDDHVSKSKLRSWNEKYFSFTKDFDRFDTVKFIERIKSRLPENKALFKKAEKKYDWSWELLAAISYQESHWNPKAKSPTGVRGLMMLTRITAKEVGVKNRLDPEQSVMGGARYLKKLESRIPKYIPKPDRVWMALAAYNVGFSHLRDARGVTAWINDNPNRWSGVSKALPLLSKKKYYKRLPNGYARGWQPVIYVNRIRNYHDLLLEALEK